MRILQLSPRFVLPDDDGGKIGIYNITKFLSEFGAEIWFAFYHNNDHDDKYLEKLAQYCHPIPIQHSTKNTPVRILTSALKDKSIYFEKHYFKPAVEILSEIVRKNKIQIIHCDHSGMMPVAVELKRRFALPIGLRLHNVEYKIWERYAERLSKFNPKAIYISRQANLLKQKEVEFLNYADISFPITEVDGELVRKNCPMANIKVVSAGVDLDKFVITSENRNLNEIILATVYSWVHNVNGLKWFLECCFENIVREVEDAVLVLIGKDMPRWLRKLDSPNIRVLGYVDDVVQYFNRASIYIAPLFVGSGIRIKILEAMAMGLPVVATSVASEGIYASEEDGLFIADDAKKFSEKVIELLKGAKKDWQIRENARRFIENNFSWRNNVKIIYEEYSKLLEQNVSLCK